MEVEHGPVGRGGGVVADLAPHGVPGLRHPRRVLHDGDEAGARDFQGVTRTARLRQAAVERRHDHLAEVARRADAVGDDPVGDLARHLVHQRAHRGEEDPGRPERVRRRSEDRRHEGVGVELALEARGPALVPRGPDRPQGEHELPHPSGRVRPRRAEALLDMPPHLRAHPQHDPTLRVLLQLVGRVRQAHRVAGEGDGDACPEQHRRRVLGRQRERQEGVVRRLGSPQAVEPCRLGRRHPVGHPRQRSAETAVDLHRAPRPDVLIRRRTGAGVGAGPLTAGVSTDNDSGIPTWTKRPAAGCR